MEAKTEKEILKVNYFIQLIYMSQRVWCRPTCFWNF